MTLKLMSRAGRITTPGHIMAVVQKLLGKEALHDIGRIRLMDEGEQQGAFFFHLRDSILRPPVPFTIRALGLTTEPCETDKLCSGLIFVGHCCLYV